MLFFKLLVVAIVQAISEFLPISSSGHMNLFKYLFQLPDGLYLDVFFNTATLLSVLVFFRTSFVDFIKKAPLLVVSTLPVVIMTMFFLPYIESYFFNNISFLPFSFLITSIFLFSTRPNGTGQKDVDLTKALLIGLAQTIAVIPGISRSAATISTALILGMSVKNAFTYSFYMYIPVSVGALLINLLRPSAESKLELTYIVPFIICAITGFFAIKILKKIVLHKHFWKFGFYTLLISVICFLVTF